MESAMNEDAAREDIAFIRRTIEQGRRVAGAWSPDMLVWGVAVAIGYFGTYGRLRGLWRIDPDWLWVACILLPWAYSLRRVARRPFARQLIVQGERPLAAPLSMLWFACGIFLTILSLAVIVAGEPNAWWINPAAAGVMGIGFFVSSFLSNLAWLRWVAVAWWAGELAAFALRHHPEGLLLAGALMLVLLALPGFVLMRGRPIQGAA
jgi:hypothetical protein